MESEADVESTVYFYKVDKFKDQTITDLYRERLKFELSKIGTLYKLYNAIIQRIRAVASQTLGTYQNPLELNLRSESQACISLYLHEVGNSLRIKDLSDVDLQSMPSEQKWLSHFKDLFTEDTYKGILKNSANTKNQTVNITSDMIKTALKTRKDGKASGPGNIPIELIKNGPPELFGVIAELFTKFITGKEQFPDEWKAVYIIPQLKKGTLDDPKNYRPISVPNTFNRLYGRVLLDLLRRDFDEAEEQAAYRKGRGIIDHLYTLKEICKKRLSVGKDVHLIFVDVKAAFDSVPWAGLFAALEWAEIHPIVISAIRSFYTGSTACVYLHQTGEFTDYFSLSKGIKQGCCLSPTLFNLYTEYVLRKWKHAWNDKGIVIHNSRTVYTLQFADDQVLLAESKYEMENMFSGLVDAYKEGGLSLNQDKTKYMYMGFNTDLINKNLYWKTTNESGEIKYCLDYQYLGSTITNYGEVESLYKRIKEYQEWGTEMFPKWSSKEIPEIKKEIFERGRLKLTYGSELWTLNKNGEAILVNTERELLKKILVNKNMTKVCKETDGRIGLLTYIENKRMTWINNVKKMENGRLPKLVMDYNPTIPE